jgi:dTDP-4-amino-4,6-dideoxygalactose transaminase
MSRLVTAYRGCRILYNFLLSNKEVIRKPFLTPVNVCESVIKTFEEARVAYKYVDINSITLCMDKQFVLELTNDISGILFVHTYGLEDNFDDFFIKVKTLNPNLLVIDDKCLCEPSFDKPQIADLTLYSLGSKKQVKIGFGAFAYVNNVMYADYSINQPSFLSNEDWTFDEKTISNKLLESREIRKQLNQIYKELLPKEIQLQEKYQNWRFNILVENRDKVLKEIFNKGLFASAHYKSLYSMPNADFISSRIINLFNDSFFTISKAEECCKIINSYL